MRNVVGLYRNLEDAFSAVQALNKRGYRKEDMTLIARDLTGKYAQALDDIKTHEGQNLADGTAKGAGIGGLLGGIGGLLVGLGALAIPGVGPVIAAGPIISTLVGAGVGAAAGGLLGLLIDLGIPEDQAKVYAEGLRKGGTLLVVRAEDDRADQAADVMNVFHPLDLDKKAAWWRQELVDQEAGDVIERPSLGETLNAKDAGAFEEWSVDFLEVREEPVINKEVEVAEEVRVYKEVSSRGETVSETVRRQKVETERTDLDKRE